MTRRLGDLVPRRRSKPPPAPTGLVGGPTIAVGGLRDALGVPDNTTICAELPPNETGLFAVTHADGALARFVRLGDGAIVGWQLQLDPGVASGRAVLEAGSGGSADFEVYRNGTYERFDAWSDNSSARRKPWGQWLNEWVAAIAKRG
jgi:hypothetical protein